MKNFKRGFSLAELLLAVGIIGIITAMGMAITKHTAENAYRGYWYTGYINLYNAIGDFNGRQLFDSGNVTKSAVIISKSTMAEQLRIVFNDTAGSDTKVNTKNGIQYEVTDYIAGSPSPSKDTYTIRMTVPQPKTRANINGTGTADLLYDRGEGLLIPLTTGVNLQNRRDLLPTYYETGVNNNNSNRIRSQRNRAYMSYRQAYCRNIKENIEGAILKCDSITRPTETIPGVITVVNPAKVR